MFVKSKFYLAWKNTFARGLKKKRIDKMLQLANIQNISGCKIKILELGCANGKDAVQFLDNSNLFDITGVDIKDYGISQDNFTFVQADAADLPFEDKSFDVVISIGLLEHIEPMEKLSSMIKEIDRVGKSYVNVIPSISSPLEPHAVRPFWGTRMHKKFVHKYSHQNILKLNYFSDHTWSKFEGFLDSEIKRIWYMFPIIRNLIVYKPYNSDV